MTKVKPTPNKQAEAVAQFFKVFKPTVKMEKLIREEFNEFVTEVEDNVSSENELKELCDLLYVVYGKAYTSNAPVAPNPKEINEIIDSIATNKDKYPNVNLPLTIIATAYVELITSNYDFTWIYRMAQGCYAYAKIKGWDIDKAFNRVHISNMSKLGIDKKPIYNAEGKVLKSDCYKPCDLSDLVTAKVKEIKYVKPLESVKKRIKRDTNKQHVLPRRL